MSGWGSAVWPKSASQALQFQADRRRDGQARGPEVGSLPAAKMAPLSQRHCLLPISHSLAMSEATPREPLTAPSTAVLSKVHANGVTPSPPCLLPTPTLSLPWLLSRCTLF